MPGVEGDQFDPASFRDPAARVVRHDGEILRYLTPTALHDWEALASTQFFEDGSSSGRIVATERADPSPTLPIPWVAVLHHETIPVVTYPYEWCFSMLQDAALLQLNLLLAALDEGMTLKDSTPFNVQWRGTQPVFIDIGSFKVAETGEPWLAIVSSARCSCIRYSSRPTRTYRFIPGYAGVSRGWKRGISTASCP